MREFGIKNLSEYHDLYLKTDVTLLTDVFELFRKTCLKNHGLDLAHYYTALGLSWDALLKHTKEDIELQRDYDMHLFVKNGMRGGISMENRRHC